MIKWWGVVIFALVLLAGLISNVMSQDMCISDMRSDVGIYLFGYYPQSNYEFDLLDRIPDKVIHFWYVLAHQKFKLISFNKVYPMESVSLAPGVPPADTSTTVWAYWGGTVYHQETCRYIIKSKKVKELLYCFSVERGTKMGLKPCSSCFKVVK